MTEQINTEIYLGPRDLSFKKLIQSLLEKANLKSKYINFLTRDENMKLFGQAFTASSADSELNYEFFEQLGDVSANKFIVWYAYKRFPQLKCPFGVKIVARLRINYGAKQSFAKIAENLGFWNFISAAQDGQQKGFKFRMRNKKDLLEDCLEAFLGCVEYILDQEYVVGVGYAIVFDILEYIFNEMPMSLEYEDLYDPKTILKELFDTYKTLGNWTFVNRRVVTNDDINTQSESYLYRIPLGEKIDVDINNLLQHNDFESKLKSLNWILLSKGVSSIKVNSEKIAAKEGLKILMKQGFYKDPPEEYKYFSQFLNK